MATAAFIIIGIIAPIVYGLERNERRQAGPHAHLSGSAGTQDRDLERTWHDISASRRV
jgi:hypothetical protein